MVQGYIDNKGQLVLELANRGTLGTVFKAYWAPMTDTQSSFQYTVEAGKALTATPVTVGPDGAYDCAVYGPNGYLREFRGSNASALAAVKPEVTLSDTFTDAFAVLLNNRAGKKACLFQVSDNAYYKNRAVEILVPRRRRDIDPLGDKRGRRTRRSRSLRVVRFQRARCRRCHLLAAARRLCG